MKAKEENKVELKKVQAVTQMLFKQTIRQVDLRRLSIADLYLNTYISSLLCCEVHLWRFVWDITAIACQKDKRKSMKKTLLPLIVSTYL